MKSIRAQTVLRQTLKATNVMMGDQRHNATNLICDKPYKAKNVMRDNPNKATNVISNKLNNLTKATNIISDHVAY